MNTQKLYQFDQARDSIQFRISGRGVLLLLAAFLVFCTPSFAQARSLSNNSHTSNVSIAYDETQSGAIVSPVGTVGYSFQGQVGENILVRVMVTSGNLDPEFRLFRPDGTLLCDGRTLGAFVEKTCIINATGPHEILISAWGGNTTGNFDLYLQRTSNPVGQINLPFDETQSAAITPSIDLNAHTFTAVPQTPPPPSTSLPIKAYLPIITGGGSNAFSDSVLVRMKATSGSLDPQFRVFRPDGSLLCAGQTLGSFVETLCLVDRSGDHAILAGAWNANATGNYDLYIQSTAYPANATPIAYDETQSASVSLPVDLNAYTFEGTAGDQVLVRMRATAGSIDPQFRVYRPNGNLLCNGQTFGAFVEMTCTLDTSGVHVVLVGAWDANATGSYDLYLQRTNNPANVTPIAYDEVQSGSISPSIDLNAYTFTESVGVQVLVQMDVTSGSLDPQIRVYRPDGSLLCSAQSLGSFVEVVCLLDTTGSHTILVGAWSANATGNYTLLMNQQ